MSLQDRTHESGTRASLTEVMLRGARADREAVLHSTIELAPTGLAHFDVSGRFLMVNRHLCSLLGYERDALLARTFQDITFPEDLEGGLALHERLISGAIEHYRHERRFVRRDGALLWTRVSVSAVRDEDDEEIAFFIGVAEDITAQHAYDDALERAWAREREAHAESEHAKHWRDEMVAVVSHDLRNPLQTIALSAELLALPHLAPEQRSRQLDILRRTAREMDRLISDLLDASRIDAGSFVVAQHRVDIGALLQETREQFEAAAAERDLTLVCEVASALPQVLGDRHRLTQVLSNLVGNAFKFTEPCGRVTLRAALADDAIQISVEDTGAGVTSEQLPHLFDRFWQADRGSTGGIGLGLAIAKGIVEAHGGRIWANSVCGSGTTIHFAVPTAR